MACYLGNKYSWMADEYDVYSGGVMRSEEVVIAASLTKEIEAVVQKHHLTRFSGLCC